MADGSGSGLWDTIASHLNIHVDPSDISTIRLPTDCSAAQEYINIPYLSSILASTLVCIVSIVAAVVIGVRYNGVRILSFKNTGVKISATCWIYFYVLMAATTGVQALRLYSLVYNSQTLTTVLSWAEGLIRAVAPFTFPLALYHQLRHRTQRKDGKGTAARHTQSVSFGSSFWGSPGNIVLVVLASLSGVSLYLAYVVPEASVSTSDDGTVLWGLTWTGVYNLFYAFMRIFCALIALWLTLLIAIGLPRSVSGERKKARGTVWLLVLGYITWVVFCVPNILLFTDNTTDPGPTIAIVESFGSLPELSNEFASLFLRLQRDAFTTSKEVALQTVAFLRHLIRVSRVKLIVLLLEVVKQTGHALQSAAPHTVIVGNVCLSVLLRLKEEYDVMEGSDTPLVLNPTLRDRFDIASSKRKDNFQRLDLDAKAQMVEACDTFSETIRSEARDIAKYSLEHIHSDDIVLTVGYSEVVAEFLRFAAKTRRFTVVVCERAPFYDGHAMVRALTNPAGGAPVRPKGKGSVRHPNQANAEPEAEKMSVVLIPDATSYAFMARVTKVIVQPECVFLNGDLFCKAGAAVIASAAMANCVPVVALSGSYRLSPGLADPARLVSFAPPELLLSGHAGVDSHGGMNPLVPLNDIVNASVCKVVVTQFGGIAAQHAFRVVQQQYDARDTAFF
ncbi:initiation factor 2B-related [Kipferlia bialata]|uniref:Translation initiation factor eIF2B subunit beta n=1 Tax=Kipferlia bialata TaxID=797122 RepID=A0A9K3CLH1_9EUKA|nr:initiation factor 2B-related [Kipferlia bialata]|eukprot:g58.t1